MTFSQKSSTYTTAKLPPSLLNSRARLTRNADSHQTYSGSSVLSVEMSELERSLSLDEEIQNVYPEGYFWYEPEDPDEILEFVREVLQSMVEGAVPDPDAVLTLEKAAKCLSVLGKIWNLTECPEGCEIDSVNCATEDERLLDMEGYVEEYQYLHLQAADLGLSDIRVIPQHFVWLLSVDLSGNRLTNISACPLTKLPNLVGVKLNRNRIADPYLEPIKHLQYLGLNSNRIGSTHRIYHPNLLHLDLNWNRISKVDGKDCWKLKKLEELELRGNKLSTTAGIEFRNLVALYLAENQITRLHGLQHLPNLSTLHLRNNPLSDLSGFTAQNHKLEYLNIRSCRVGDVQELGKLQVLKSLKVLVVKDNLFNRSQEGEEGEGEDDDDIKIQILAILPQLKIINKTSVTREELRKAKTLLEQQEFV